MCGIAGTVGGNTQHALDQVKVMTAALSRRGPDAEGLDCFPGGAVLGHRRLSIFDLSAAGRQPMSTPDHRLSVVFNGAIYNFHALRAELIERGYQFHSRTDTEVLLHGFDAWGIDGLVARLRGMFAFGLWDDAHRRLFLVRDRLGVKPLLYSQSPSGGLTFASTARALALASRNRSIDPDAVLEYLEFGWVSGQRSIYEGIQKLPPATILQWDAEGSATREWTYWSVPPPEPLNPGTSFEQIVEETGARFREAVKLRLEADVPVGALLSGGIDSSLVCWAVADAGADITAFTVATGGIEDESADAAAIAKRLGIRHQVIALQDEEWPAVEELVAAYGEPFSCASALGMLRVSRAVHEHATVLLTGDGGDDVFLGYPEHRNFWRAQQLARSLPGFAADALRGASTLIPQSGPAKRAANFLKYATGGLGAVTAAHDGLPFYQQHGLLGERLAGHELLHRQIPWSAQAGRTVLADFLDYEHRMRFDGEYMTKVDGGSMHYALEARSPFLDQQIWEAAARLPYDVRLHGGELKAVLRALTRKHLGEAVASGPKRGFTIPVERWLATRWRSQAEEFWHESRSAERGWVNPAALRALWTWMLPSGRVPTQFWRLFVLEAWLRAEHA